MLQYIVHHKSNVGAGLQVTSDPNPYRKVSSPAD